MNEYDEVELMVDQPQWELLAGARGAVVDLVPDEDVVAVEFYRPNEENVVHLAPIRFLRVTDRYETPPLTKMTVPRR
ncbi:MAG: DUF4926 domain-containing protein [Chloroflexota bacterium]|nr:DUF4926 domain-containing protein [Chloroflexota bacterium]